MEQGSAVTASYVKRPHSVLAAACLALVTLAATIAWAGASVAASLDDAARVIAGFDTRAGQAARWAEDEATARAYSNEVSAYWREYERKIGNPMRQWACKELPRAEGGTVFYPFAGPDLPAAYQLFPDANRYVLLSMQRGEPPPLLESYSKGELDEYVEVLRKAWRFYNVLGFFRTDDLDGRGKSEGKPIGVTGALMAFAVRLGFEVEAVDPIQLDLNTNQLILRARTPEVPSTWDSVRLTLRKDGRKVIVDHVRVDLSDAALGRDPGPRKWIESVAVNPTLLKAASHHPQGREFSIFRDIVLAKAPLIVQDETGIDYALLDPAFDVRLYGKFTHPNSSFSQTLQKSLAAAYAKGAGVKPLPFSAGYEKDAGSAFQVAIREAGGGSRPRSCAGKA